MFLNKSVLNLPNFSDFNKMFFSLQLILVVVTLCVPALAVSKMFSAKQGVRSKGPPLQVLAFTDAGACQVIPTTVT